jgi:carboxyl-terminal processing protease
MEKEELTMKPRKWLRLVLFSLLSLGVVGGVFAGGFSAGRSSVPQPVVDVTAVSVEDLSIFAPFVQTWATVQSTYYFDLPTNEKLMEGAIKGMLKMLPSDYDYYFPPRRAKIQAAMMSGQVSGIGVKITTENGQLVIISTEPGGPAEKAGIKAGDQIIAVDGEDISGLGWDEQAAAIRGEPGSKIIVSVYRLGEGNLEFEVTRETIVTPTVMTRILADGRVGYINLDLFANTSAGEVREAIKKLRGAGVEALVFDLRGNPGGNLGSAVTILSQFLPGDTVVCRTYGSDGSVTALTTQPGGLATDLPLIVLIDSGSASASELSSAALKDYKRAVLIGVTTHGKGVGQMPQTLSDGSLLMIVSFEFRSPLGHVVQGVGVDPDIPIPTSPFDRQRGKDPALDKAIEVLLGKLAAK